MSFISPSCDRVLQALGHPARPGPRRFPAAFGADSRLGTAERPGAWFRRLVDRDFAGWPGFDGWQLERHLALFAEVRWADRCVSFARVQALVVLPEDKELSDVYCARDDRIACQYYRLELDPESRGRLFSHPQPHVHVRPDGAPRFPVAFGHDTLVAGFLEFLYLNHAYDVWEAWLRQAWAAAFPAGGKYDVDRLDELLKTFPEDSFLAGLPAFADRLDRLKKLLANERQAHAWPVSSVCSMLDHGR